MSMRGQLHLQHDSPSATDLLKKIFMIRGFSSYFNLVTLDSLNEVTLLQATIAQMLVCFNSKKNRKSCLMLIMIQTTPTIEAGIYPEVDAVASIHSLAMDLRDRDPDEQTNKDSVKKPKEERDRPMKDRLLAKDTIN